MNGGKRRERRRPTGVALVKDIVDLSDDYELVSSAATAEQPSSGDPKFGSYLRNRRCNQAIRVASQMNEIIGGTTLRVQTAVDDTMTKSKEVPTSETNKDSLIEQNPTMLTETPVEQVVGRSLKSVGAYKSLDRSAQVVALINEVSIFSTFHEYHFDPPWKMQRKCSNTINNIIIYSNFIYDPDRKKESKLDIITLRYIKCIYYKKYNKFIPIRNYHQKKIECNPR